MTENLLHDRCYYYVKYHVVITSRTILHESLGLIRSKILYPLPHASTSHVFNSSTLPSLLIAYMFTIFKAKQHIYTQINNGFPEEYKTYNYNNTTVVLNDSFSNLYLHILYKYRLRTIKYIIIELYSYLLDTRYKTLDMSSGPFQCFHRYREQNWVSHSQMSDHPHTQKL